MSAVEFVMIIISLLLIIFIVGLVGYASYECYKNSEDPYYDKPTLKLEFSDNISVGSKRLDYGDGTYVIEGQYFIEDVKGDVYKTTDLNIFNKLNKGGIFTVRSKDYYIYRILK